MEISPPLPSGVIVENAADRTPGNARSRSRRTAVSAAPVSLNSVLTSSTPLRRKPACVVVRFRNEFSNNVAEVSSTNDSATCPATSAQPTPRRERPTTLRPCAFNAFCGSACAERHAGASPKSTPQATAVTIVKASTRRSMARSSHVASPPADRKPISTRVPQLANSTPSAAPSSERSIASVSIRRISRARPAPSARRTAASCCRTVARASSRFATLAHAMSSTSATTTIRTRSAAAYSRRSSEKPFAAGSTVSVRLR